MVFKTIQVEPLSPVIGAEIGGVDLATPLADETVREIHDALMAHQVVFFRDQEMTLDQHKAFARRFGELHIHPSAKTADGHPEVITIHADETTKAVAGMKWHSDVSCDAEPPMGSVLQMQTIPPVGGDTMFASTYAAYEALSDRVKALIADLKAWHESARVHRDRFGAKGRMRDGIDVYPESLHPVVRTHPVSGRKGLFVNENFTSRIDGLPKRESDAILDILYEQIATPEFHCRFRWTAGAVAFWDNRSAQHRSVWDYYPALRHGYRVTIAGDAPF